MMYKAYLLICWVTFSLVSLGQNKTDDKIQMLDTKLRRGEVTVSDVLSDENVMSLHSITAFREVVKRHAKPGPLTIVTNSEVGVRITVNGTVVSNSGAPLKDVLIYFYQTSDKGWYSDTTVHISGNEGDHRHARLFGYLKTDYKGAFTFTTIRPQGYPQSDLPAHIHIQLWDSNSNLLIGAPGELLFDDDPRMTPARRQRSLSEGFLIAPNQGSKEKPVYNFRLVTRVE